MERALHDWRRRVPRRLRRPLPGPRARHPHLADVCRELALCVVLPVCSVRGAATPWDSVALFHTSTQSAAAAPAHVLKEEHGMRVPCLPPTDATHHNPLTYHIVRHDSTCALLSDPKATLADHIREKCATHLFKPSRRYLPFYLPPDQKSSDPRVASMPLQGQTKTSQRSATISITPESGTEDTVLDESVRAFIAPRWMPGSTDNLARLVAEFRPSCLVHANACAATGLGASWFPSCPVGPGVSACHIVPPHHYHLYPTSDRAQRVVDDSPANLTAAWLATWSPSNGILLLRHMHEFLAARLFAIHPDTLRIRAFVPYRPLVVINGQRADVPEIVDRNALRHHYDMCCVENMGAWQPVMSGTGVGVASRAVQSLGDAAGGCGGVERQTAGAGYADDYRDGYDDGYNDGLGDGYREDSSDGFDDDYDSYPEDDAGRGRKRRRGSN